MHSDRAFVQSFTSIYKLIYKKELLASKDAKKSAHILHRSDFL